jgi:hypothetical protein
MSRTTLLMTVRGQEAEPALVEVGETEATIELDDGARVTFDATELRAALTLKQTAGENRASQP